MTATGRCVICEDAIPPHLSDAPFCGKFDCRVVYEQTPANRRCVVCGRILPAHAAEGICSRLECANVLLGRQYAEEERQRRARMTEEGEALREQWAGELGIPNPADYRIQILPAFCNRIGPLPESRREVFLKNLRDAIDEGRRLAADALASRSGDVEPGVESMAAGGQADEADDACRHCGPLDAEESTGHGSQDPISQLLMFGCTICRGYCCRNGGEHAFLTPQVMARHFERDQTLNPDHLFERYASHLPAESFENSCVYQGVHGCALPGAMRASVCHEYLCPDLAELRDAAIERQSPRAFLAAGNRDALQAAGFVEAGQLRIVVENRTSAAAAE